MKKLIIIMIVLASCNAFAAGVLQRDMGLAPVQMAAPNPYESQLLTVYSTTIDVSANIGWVLYSPTACKFRVLPTSAKSTFPAFTAPALATTSQAVHTNTKFANFSGCASGELSRY